LTAAVVLLISDGSPVPKDVEISEAFKLEIDVEISDAFKFEADVVISEAFPNSVVMSDRIMSLDVVDSTDTFEINADVVAAAVPFSN